jgi:hypothetical protein
MKLWKLRWVDYEASMGEKLTKELVGGKPERTLLG